MVDSKPLLQDRPPAYNAVPGAYDYGGPAQPGYGAIPSPAPPPPYPYPAGQGEYPRSARRRKKRKTLLLLLFILLVPDHLTSRCVNINPSRVYM